MKKKDEWITGTGLIEKRGWTKSMIGKLTMNLNVRIVDNPHYKCAPSMKLYCLKDIKRIEKTKRFKLLKEKADRRKESAKKSVETKIKNVVQLADNFSVTVQRIDLEELREETLASKQAWYDSQILNRNNYDFRDAYSAPQEDVERWEVNFIRHNLSDYDEQLEILNGKMGKFVAYWHYKEKLANEMKRIYPELINSINLYMLGIQEKNKV